MPKIVAEIACNHRGELDTAVEMVRQAAAFCRADIVKFQKRDVVSLLSPEQFHAPHPNPMHAYGANYGEHRLALEFSLVQHRELQKICGESGIGYSCSVWDERSAREIVSLEPAMIKVPSATNTNAAVLEILAKEYSGEIHISLGMTTRAEETAVVETMERLGRAKDVVLYACTSAYPVEFSDIYLGEITRLKQSYGERVKAIGFSGHHLGIAADIAALALGAEWFERHFTLNRTWRGTDHAASLEPDGLRRLCRDLRAVAQTLKPKPTEILEVERPQRRKLKWGIAGRE